MCKKSFSELVLFLIRIVFYKNDVVNVSNYDMSYFYRSDLSSASLPVRVASFR
jgi:hypothetical protein